jgi:hypothetical protein
MIWQTWDVHLGGKPAEFPDLFYCFTSELEVKRGDRVTRNGFVEVKPSNDPFPVSLF